MTYFHGTNAELQIGDILVPGVQIGKDFGRSNHVYLVSDENCTNAVAIARCWAEVAVEMDESSNTTSPNVYTVQPLGEVEKDNACDDQVGEESFRTSSAVITSVVC